jgi:hypothetical protein
MAVPCGVCVNHRMFIATDTDAHKYYCAYQFDCNRRTHSNIIANSHSNIRPRCANRAASNGDSTADNDTQRGEHGETSSQICSTGDA